MVAYYFDSLFTSFSHFFMLQYLNFKDLNFTNVRILFCIPLVYF